MLLQELYQEHKSSTFTHDGEEYSLNDVFKAVDHVEVQQFDVADLKWVLEFTDVTPKRVKAADISKPVLITKWKKKLVVIDGAHRLSKAVEQNVDTLPGKLVSSAQLKQSKIK